MPQAKVFISHATTDAQFANKLAEDLRQLGITVWIDTNMEPGIFIDNISKGLQSDVLLLVLSPDALHSKWVNNEMNAAISRVSQGLMRPPIIIAAKPYNLSDIPAMWAIYHRFDLTENYPVILHKIAQYIHAETVYTTTPLPTIWNIGRQKVSLEMFWGLVKDVEGPKVDVDYAMFICHRDPSDPNKAYLYKPEDIVYWPEKYHVYPHGKEKEEPAIIRSSDDVEGGNTTEPDETGTIDFSKLPDDIIRIVIYIHIYHASTTIMTQNGYQTQQLFKHANVRFNVKGDDGSPIAVINLGQSYPNNWGIVLCEFLKNNQNQWNLVSKKQPLDGDDISACIQGYSLAAPGVVIRLQYL